MQMILPILGAVATLVGGMQQSSALRDAAKREEAAAESSRRLAAQNAANIEAETAEQVRRESQAAETEASQRKAAAGASGGLLTGSTANYLETQEERAGEYVDWLERSGASRADIAREEGETAYQRGMAGAEATRGQASAARWGAFGGVSNLFRLF